MPFKIFILYSTNETIYAFSFSGNIFPKIKRISGPQYMSCQKKATGKFMKVVWSHTATNWEPAFLNKIVAKCGVKLLQIHFGCNAFSVEEQLFGIFSFAKRKNERNVLCQETKDDRKR